MGNALSWHHLGTVPEVPLNYLCSVLAAALSLLCPCTALSGRCLSRPWSRHCPGTGLALSLHRLGRVLPLHWGLPSWQGSPSALRNAVLAGFSLCTGDWQSASTVSAGRGRLAGLKPQRLPGPDAVKKGRETEEKQGRRRRRAGPAIPGQGDSESGDFGSRRFQVPAIPGQGDSESRRFRVMAMPSQGV